MDGRRRGLDLGIALVPADRAREAIIPDFSVSENLTISVLDRLTSRGKLGKTDSASWCSTGWISLGS